jgi:hypothetical protein
MSEKLYPTAMGYTTRRPDVTLPPLDRRALMQSAHRIARNARRHFASYAQALAYGLKAAWQQVKVARDIAMIRAQIKPREYTAADWAASTRATRRCGSSLWAA